MPHDLQAMTQVAKKAAAGSKDEANMVSLLRNVPMNPIHP